MWDLCSCHDTCSPGWSDTRPEVNIAAASEPAVESAAVAAAAAGSAAARSFGQLPLEQGSTSEEKT